SCRALPPPSCRALPPPSCRALMRRTEVETDEDALGVREIADDLLDRHRQTAHQRRDREDLVALSELRIDDQIDHLDAVPAGEMLVTELLQIGDGAYRLRCLPGDVQPERPEVVVVRRNAQLVLFHPPASVQR